MARGTPLNVLRKMLKAEIGYDQGNNPDQDMNLNTLLSNKQSWIATEFDFPFLEQRWDLNVPPLTRYISLPTLEGGPVSQQVAINFERPVLVEVFYTNSWQDVDPGIGSEEYNWLNSDQAGQIQDPILRWRMASNATDGAQFSQIEVWPIPATQQTLRFTGQRTLYPLEADDDLADLDDMMLVYFVAGELLLDLNKPKAQRLMTLAEIRLRQTKANYPTREHKVVLGRKLLLPAKMRNVVPMIITK